RSAWCGFNGAALFRERKVRPRPRAVAEASPGFNGAALFRERKAAYFPDSAREAIRFNGAALFRERKGLDRRQRLLVEAVDALMGPPSFESGKRYAASAPQRARAKTRFNGAALIRERKGAEHWEA